MKSLAKFPKQSGTFDCDAYGIDVRQQVGADTPYTGEVGLELELEGRGLPERFGGRPVGSSTWVYHADGSLRAVGGRGPGGAEYVLSQPCPRSDVKPLVDGLFDYLKVAGAEVQNSTRCSTHVHLNMKGVKLNQLASFVILWGTFEDVLANYCGGHRSGNHFALRMSDCSGSVDNWTRAFKTGCFDFNRERRYLALNPACLQTFGSLEVRTMAGATNSAEVVTWVEMLLKLKDAALSPEFSNPQAIAGEFSGNGVLGFSERILGRECVEMLRQACDEIGDNFDRLIVDGFRRVQGIAYDLPWSAVNEAVVRPFVPNPFGGTTKKRLRMEMDEEGRIRPARARGIGED